MFIYRYIVIILYMCLAISHVNADPHNNFWTRLSLTQPITSKWRAEGELQHRRQNNLPLATNCLIKENLLSSVRLWVHYQHREDLSFSFLPYGYYWHNSIIQTEQDLYKPQVREMRFAAAIDLKHEVINRLWLIDRSCIEYREYINSSPNIFRMRNRLGIRFDFNENWNFTFFDEVFLNIKTPDPVNLFDHDRIAFLINYKPTKHLRIETGYIFISRLPKGSDEFLHENNFLVHVYYILPHKEHRKHPTTQHHS